MAATISQLGDIDLCLGYLSIPFVNIDKFNIKRKKFYFDPPNNNMYVTRIPTRYCYRILAAEMLQSQYYSYGEYYSWYSCYYYHYCWWIWYCLVGVVVAAVIRPVESLEKRQSSLQTRASESTQKEKRWQLLSSFDSNRCRLSLEMECGYVGISK